MFWRPLAELHIDLCAGKRSGNYPGLTYRFCPAQIPAKLSGSSAINFLGNLIGLNNYNVNSMFILQGLLSNSQLFQ